MVVGSLAGSQLAGERRYQRRTEVANRGNWGETVANAKGRRREQEFWEEHLRRHKTLGLRRHHTLGSPPTEECINPNVRQRRRKAQQFASLEDVSALMEMEDDWSKENTTGRKTSRKATILRAESMGHLESRTAHEGEGEKTAKKQKKLGIEPQWIPGVGESLQQAREIAEGSSIARKSSRRSSRSFRHSTRRTSESFRRDRQLKEVKKRKGMRKGMGSLVSRSCSVLRLFSMKRETKEKPKTSFERPKCLRSDSSEEVTQKSDWEGWLRSRRLRGLVGRSSQPTRRSAWLQPERHVCQRGANNVTRWEFSTKTTYGGFPRC